MKIPRTYVMKRTCRFNGCQSWIEAVGSFNKFVALFQLAKQVLLWTAGVLRSVTVPTKSDMLVDSTAQPVSHSVGICDFSPMKGGNKSLLMVTNFRLMPSCNNTQGFTWESQNT